MDAPRVPFKMQMLDLYHSTASREPRSCGTHREADGWGGRAGPDVGGSGRPHQVEGRQGTGHDPNHDLMVGTEGGRPHTIGDGQFRGPGPGAQERDNG